VPPKSDDLAVRLAGTADLFPPRRRYLVGLSGGRDSVVLLDILHRLKYRNLVLCHLNHRLRGQASAADARLAARLANDYGYPVEAATRDVRALARARKASLETAARAARLEFFAESGAKWRCRRLFLAHHAGDQVETILMNFFRGAGGAGLKGMRAASIQQVGRSRLELLRPLLEVTREEITAYAVARGLLFRDDASNESGDCLRNRVRHELLPAIDRVFGRNTRAAVRRAAEIADAEEAWLAALADKLRAEAADGEGLSTKCLLEIPPAAQRRVLLGWLRAQGVPDTGFDLVESLRGLLLPGSPTAKLNLPGGTHARRRAGRLFIDRSGQEP